MRLFVSYFTGNYYLRHRFDQRRINKRKCMDNLLRCLSFPVVSLLVVHFVAESRVGGAVCGGPYAYNGRPVHIPAEEYAKYCCKADKYGSWTSSSRFDCASEGGCCGEVDKQYCCDRDKIALQLGLGITGGALVLLAIIALIVYCCIRSFYSDLNEEIYCDGCCICRVRRKEQRINYWDEVARDGHRTTQQRSVISSTDEPDTDPEPISLMVPTAPPTETPTAPPSAPPAYDPRAELDAPPPSYSDVIRNPHIFPQTGKRHASTTV
ncbi:uncharacterized protein LOC124258665 isoform X2 [Haliotis rubra]|uniref:uncharacterized protein LOC124258665 isoform X2 n=1 Tax=Haliotis rubra TaxID=36100 RepID=UPI001EE5432D|nr:uncharacterized protein LOC124258665 isoform X2 [Haliotis rubra]